jgi:hypothetical protein
MSRQLVQLQKAAEKYTKKGNGLGRAINQPCPAGIGLITLTAKDNLPHC